MHHPPPAPSPHAGHCGAGANQWIESHFHDCIYTQRDGAGFALGLVSIAFWVCAQVPQVIGNIRNQSAEALSPWFLAQWFAGDTLNLLGCLVQGEQLATTTYLAMYFIMSDLVMLVQYIYYGALQSRREKLRRMEEEWQQRRRHGHRHRHHHHNFPGQGHGHADGGLETPPGPPLAPLPPPPAPPAPPPPPGCVEWGGQQRELGRSSSSSGDAEGAEAHASVSVPLLRGGGGEAHAQAPRAAAALSRPPWPRLPALAAAAACAAAIVLVAAAGAAYGGSGGGGGWQQQLPWLPRSGASWPAPPAGGGPSVAGGWVLLSGVVPSCDGDDYVDPWWCDSDALTVAAGTAMGYVSMCMYLTSRLSQIAKNSARQSAEGLSLAMFVLAVSANLCTGGSILLRTTAFEGLKNQAPWIAGSFGTVGMDLTIAWQAVHYGRLEKARQLGQLGQPLLGA
ncbi:hypothetical protein FOA52_010623 [Chlamydomonas sp. UWO 241]|nr:hypothetical protein FOA52_010623 [Chlamydomonas sp. UWO 241]